MSSASIPSTQAPSLVTTAPQRERALHWAALFTMAVTGPYAILFLAALLLSAALTGNSFIPNLASSAGLEYAGRFPAAVTIGSIGDGLQHIAFFVTAVAVFAVVRPRWPVWAQLILVGGACQMILALTKAVTAVHTATSLGAAYLAADAAGQA